MAYSNLIPLYTINKDMFLKLEMEWYRISSISVDFWRKMGKLNDDLKY